MTSGPGPSRAPDEHAPHAFDGQALGSPLRLQLTDIDAPTAAAAWAAVIDEFDAVDRTMSGYRADSAISRLNERAGSDEAISVDTRLYDALALCSRAWRVTEGRFDPRVFGALRGMGQPGPLAMPIRTAQPAPTRRWLCREPRRQEVTISVPLDLHGIGKGLALRWAWRRLTALLPRDRCGVLLEAGGDLVGRAPGPDEPAWLLAVEDPRGGSQPIAVVTLAGGAVCTSSTRKSTWTDASGRRLHHLIDPMTGEPGGDGLLAVTVAAPDPAWAEVWTKALFLSGRRAIGATARASGLAAWWVADDGSLEMTPAGRQRLRWP